MVLEAVWFKNGKEIYWVDPIVDILCEEDAKDVADIKVASGYHWYSAADCGEAPDDFVIRIKKEC